MNGAPPAGTTLYYRQHMSEYTDGPNVPLDTICFGAGTLIRTDKGLVPVELLRPGMMVMTRDAGPQPVIWAASSHIRASALAAAPHLQPIRIRQGTLGDGLPERDLIVSPQHRMLVRSAIALRMFGAAEVLVAAKSLLAIDGVEIAADQSDVTYVHFLLPEHHIVFAEGAESESLYTGAQALKTLGHAARRELAEIFPGILDADRPSPTTARPLVTVSKARKLAERHAHNGKPLVM